MENWSESIQYKDNEMISKDILNHAKLTGKPCSHKDLGLAYYQSGISRDMLNALEIPEGTKKVILEGYDKGVKNDC